MQDRSSEADSPVLVQDRREVAKIEAENTLRQFDESMEMLRVWLGDRSFKLRASMVLKLNRVALSGLSDYAGTYRPAGIRIKGSDHKPLDASRVPEELEMLCEYVTREWTNKTAIHLSAYVLWRINWIHPFVDGNGRTARVVSYLVLCAKLGYRLPGKLTIPEQIAQNKKPYYQALESADKSVDTGSVDVSVLEGLIDEHLANQLYEVHQDAAGFDENRAAIADLNSKDDVLSKISNNKSLKFSDIVKHIESYPVIYGAALAIAITLAGVLLGS